MHDGGQRRRVHVVTTRYTTKQKGDPDDDNRELCQPGHGYNRFSGSISESGGRRGRPPCVAPSLKNKVGPRVERGARQPAPFPSCHPCAVSAAREAHLGSWEEEEAGLFRIARAAEGRASR
ncbi:hypothetical protein MRX96_003790 [Rhipicephalus microplus]